MNGHVPTSVVLEQLLQEIPDGRVTPAWLIGHLGSRSFGFIMFFLALVGLVPGASLLAGVLLGFVAIQMMLGRASPGLPRFVGARGVPTERVARLLQRTIRILKRLEKVIHPRWRMPLEPTKRAVGLVFLLLAATLISPVPFSHVVPAMVIMLIAFAYLEEDGALLWAALVAALISLSITVATVWATIRATGLLEELLTRIWGA